jgi:hypothetical protein
MSIERLPLSYRSELLHEVYKHLAAGKCGSLIGVASSGKSRLVEFLGRPDVRQHYLGDNWTKSLFPWVDGNDLLEHSEWGLYEKVLAAIRTDLDKLPEHGGEARVKADEWYWKLVRPENRHLARRFVAYAIADLKDIDRVVLLLDDFEDFLPKADDMVFSGLRSLRDNFKKDNAYQLLYILTSRKQPVKLRESDTLAFESFTELFKNFTYPIGCYSEEDALYMIQRLSEAFPLDQRLITPELAKRLCEVTGGHAGLIDAAFHSKTEARWNRPDIAEVLITAGSVWNECTSIWESLDDEDRGALFTITSGQDPGIVATHWLEKSGLVRRDHHQTPQIFELLRLFLADSVGHGPDIKVDSARRVLTIDSCVVETLSEREFGLLRWLCEHRGKLCSYPELFQSIYPARPLLGNVQAEIQQLMQRAQGKLKKACGAKPFIIHHLDLGYRVIGSDGR